MLQSAPEQPPRQNWDPRRYARNARFVVDLGEPLTDLLAPNPGERILDLGCGGGANRSRKVGIAASGRKPGRRLCPAPLFRGEDHLVTARSIIIGALLAILAPFCTTSAAAQQVAVLQGLDKITARVSTIEAPVGEAVRFGTLDITVKRCHKRPPEETPETTAYLQIRERRSGEQSVDLFAGWMFASSPAVSSMEHPVYDVWVIDCKKASSSG